jgi:hypothetical protein
VGSNEKKIKDDQQSLYEDYWNGKWKCDLVDPKQWFNILIVFFCFLLRKIQLKKSNSYYTSCVTPIKVNLDATNASSNL